MNHPYVYIGCFVPQDSMSAVFDMLSGERLARVITSPHVTFKYRPASVDETLFGEKINIRVVGYGNNGKNEGIKVELSSDNAALVKMFNSIAVPHITLSVSASGRPVDTKDLTFSPVEPIDIVGYFGGYTTRGNVVTSTDKA